MNKQPFRFLLHLVCVLLCLKVLGSRLYSQEESSTETVKVFILSGQSNMVGAGKVDGGSSRWGKQFVDPVVSVYEGSYDPEADYDAMTPVKTLKLEKFGGVHPTPYPEGGVRVTRGFIQVTHTGIYEFRPGYSGSTNNVMEVDGKEVHRKHAGEEAVRSEITLEAGKKNVRTY
ncbi:MAG: hypothetical protein AAF483_05655 [Planctomycetota bacterium]